MLLVLIGCSKGKDTPTPEAVAYAQKVSAMLSEAQSFATTLKAGLKKSVGPRPLQAAKEFEAAAKELEAVTTAPAGLTNCFSQASKFPNTVRAAAPLWLGDPNAVKLSFALSDPGVVPKLVAAICAADQVASACRAELDKFDTTHSAKFTCP
jgi:hypothetical protein